MLVDEREYAYLKAIALFSPGKSSNNHIFYTFLLFFTF